MIKNISVNTRTRTEFVNITSDVQNIVSDSGINEGLCCIYVPHTTAALTINEGADPDVVKDILSTVNRIFPQNPDYLHMEGNSDSHIKTSLFGSSETIIIDNGKLQLGTWQAIFFCEFDGARSRNVVVKIMGDK